MSIRNFKLWNADRTSSFDLSQTGITVTSPKGFGNKFSNTIQSGNRSRRYLTDQKNDFEDISFKVLFGLKAKNAYGMYHQLSSFIQDNQRNEMILEYTRNSETLYVDVALKQFTKTEKSQFNVLEESITFERLSPFYSIVKRTGKEMLIQNNYIENILPKITIKDNSFSAPINVRLSGVNIMPNVDDLPKTVNGVTIKMTQKGTFIFNGESTADGWAMNVLYTLPEVNAYNGYMRYVKVLSGNYTGLGIRFSGGVDMIMPSDTNEEKSAVVSDDARQYIGLYMNSGTKFNNYEVEIQLSKLTSNDVPRNELNGYTLNEVYRDSNIFDKVSVIATRLYDFQNNETYVLTPNSENGEHYAEYNLQGFVSANDYIYSNVSLVDNLNYSLQINTYAWNGVNYKFERYLLSGLDYKDYSYKRQVQTEYIDNTYIFRLEVYDYQNTTVSFIGNEIDHITVKPNVYINLTALGLESLTVYALDNQYALYDSPQPLDYTSPTDYTQSLIINATLNDYDELVIDSESKEITLNNENAYDLLDKANDTFIVIPPGDYVIEADQEITVEYKKWVID